MIIKNAERHLEQLISRAQTGDSSAFVQLYISTYKKQYQFAYEFLLDELSAQYALKELYVQAYKHIQKFSSVDLFQDWLDEMNHVICLQITHNQSRTGLWNPQFS